MYTSFCNVKKNNKLNKLEMTLSIKYLSCIYEDENLTPKTHGKTLAWWHRHMIPTVGWWRKEEPGSYCLVRLAHLANSKTFSTPVLTK